MKKIEVFEKIGVILLFVALALFMIIVPNMNTNMNLGKLIINEVMLINNNTIADYDGKYNDYIEIYNGNDYDINLFGYYLTDNMKETRKWSFPDVTIKANDYLLIFASSKNKVIEGELHTNFKLDSKGETVALSDNSGKVISKVYVSESLKDTSYGYNGEEYVYYYSGTPGKENKGEYQKDPIYEVQNNYKIEITEYMTNNLNAVKSFDGKFYSVIEIHNYGNQDIDLEGFYLSDKLDNVTKYVFPKMIIKQDEYRIVYASGKNVYEKDEIHTNFKLNNKDGVIILSSPNKSLISKVNLLELDGNLSYGLYDGKWHLYSKVSLGEKNTDNFLSETIESKIRVNEVSIYPREAIEIKNLLDEDLKLEGYSISDKSGNIYSLNNQLIKKNDYLVLSNLTFSINNHDEVLYLYYDGKIVDSFKVDKLMENISTGLSDNQKVYYKTITLGKENANVSYLGFSEEPIFNIDGGYVKKGEKITLKTNNNSEIYYTTNGSFPTNKSKKYTEPITINENTVIKAISIQEGYLESDIISRTFITGREHDMAFVSISSDESSLFGSSGIITNYTSQKEKKVNWEFYESDGRLGISMLGDMKLSGMDSRKEPQKSMSVYFRKKYGLNKVTYPFFEEMDYHTYSSLLLRNAGEDPKNVRIMDAALTRILKGEMDIDMQAYRPVAVYINGKYFGLFNLREKLNGDYVESKFGIDKDDIDVIKYSLPTTGNSKDYNNLINYIKSHNTEDKEVYEYLKTKIDMQELINYWIVESFYGNTDLGNIRYWKDDTGKWRWMLYDLDWSLWNYNLDMGYPTKFSSIPAATYLSSSLVIVRNLYKNKDFKELYLTSLAKYLKNTFKPERVNEIIDDLSKEIENEMPYHILRWQGYYPSLSNMTVWRNNLNNLKNSLKTRYNKVVSNLKSNFNLTNQEYQKYFGDLL